MLGGFVLGAYLLRDRLVDRVGHLPLVKSVVGNAEIEDATEVGETSAGSNQVDPIADRRVVSSLLDTADDALDAGQPDAAVSTAYAAVRQLVGGRLDIPESATHWEVLIAANEDGFEEQALDDLESLTQAFEFAAFAADSTSHDRAETALQAAHDLADAVSDVTSRQQHQSDDRSRG